MQNYPAPHSPALVGRRRAPTRGALCRGYEACDGSRRNSKAVAPLRSSEAAVRIIWVGAIGRRIRICRSRTVYVGGRRANHGASRDSGSNAAPAIAATIATVTTIDVDVAVERIAAADI